MIGLGYSPLESYHEKINVLQTGWILLKMAGIAELYRTCRGAAYLNLSLQPTKKTASAEFGRSDIE